MRKAKQMLAGLLATLLMMQALPVTVLADDAAAPAQPEAVQTQDEAPVAEEAPAVAETADVQLQNGAAIIPSDATLEQVKELLFEALVVNKEGLNPQSLEWEYYCTGKNGLLTNDAWGSINGFTSEKNVVFVPTTFTHPALADNGDGNYQIRLAGTTAEVTLTKAAKLSSSITLNEGVKVALPYTAEGTVDFDALRANIFSQVVASTDPVMTVADVTIEYYATAITGAVGDLGKAWMPLEGGKDTLTYPAISAGEQKIRISYAGTETVKEASAETTITVTERPEASYTLKETPDAVTLAVDEALNVDYAALRTAIFNAVVASSDVLTADNVTIEYYYKGITELDSKWLPLEGQAVVGGLGYPAISAGQQKVRISWPGNKDYAPTTIEATLTVNDRPAVEFVLNDGPYEVGMVFTDDQGYDYDATAAAIYEAVVASTTPALTAADVTVEYNVDRIGGTDRFKPLNETDLTGLIKFGTGNWEIRISWPGSREYRGGEVVVDVTTTDSRLASAVVLKDGVSFTYNMDPAVMEQAIFGDLIDWENSTLPARETLTLDDFTIEYKTKMTDLESGVDLGLDDMIDSDLLTKWVPIEGETYELGGTVLGRYPSMGAGEAQAVRVEYKGSAEYRPSGYTEGTVTVNKATVKVTVHSTNIFADEALPEDFVTTDPADTFDLYTVYAGVTSSVSGGLYLDLPERYTSSLFLKVLDPIVEKLYGKSFTQMLNDGVTVGELRELFSTQELLDLLDKLNIDTGTFGQILSIINQLPSVADSLRISFGTPNRAGLYTVAAVTDSKNYETGVGVGFVLVKMRTSGSRLTWNQSISNGKLTAEQAKTFDFGATLSYNGDVTVDQSSVHYLYSGFTSKWRIYSSTTTPPTEPGRYVVTVCILGGNHLAAPLTRSFQITK